MQTLTFFFAFIAVLALIGVAAWLVRRFATNRLGANTNRGRMPRLAVIDAAAVDGRRRLVLVRRDNVEHLLMIGGPSDIVVEPNIVRAMPGRDQMAPRPAVGRRAAAAYRAAAGCRLERRRRARPVRSRRAADARAAAAPGASLFRRRSPPPGAAADGRTPQRTQRSFGRLRAGADGQPRRTAARSGPAARSTRTEPMMPRPQRAERAAEGAAAGPCAGARRRTAAATPAACASAAVQRRPESRRDGAAARSRPAPAGRTPIAPPVAPEPPPARPARSEAPAPAAAPQKTGFENLEDEMASLLGRPKSPS